MPRRVWNLILALALLTALPAARAAELANDADIELDRTGSIVLDLSQASAPYSTDPATFSLYQVAEVRSDGGGYAYVLTTDFADSGVTLGDLSGEDLAQALADHVGNAAPIQSQYMDEDGQVTFSDLALGLYLVTQRGQLVGYYPLEPFLVSVPLYDAAGDFWSYEINASPKMALNSRPTPPDPPPVDPDPPRPPKPTSKPPPTPSAEPTPTPTVSPSPTPTASPSPTPTPTASPSPTPSAELTMDPTPTPPADDGEPPLPPGTTPNPFDDAFPEHLIQTGPQNWPIPVLAVVGLILFALGWALAFGKEKKDDET